MSGRMASFDRGRHRGNTAAPPSPLAAPPKLLSADDSGVVSGESLVPAEAAIMSPTSTLQVAAAYPAVATAVPFSRRGATSSASGGDRWCKSRSSSRSHHRPAWEARQPAGLGLAGALHGGDAVPPAATVLTGGQSVRSPAFAAGRSAPARSSSPRGRRRRLMSPREMEASEGCGDDHAEFLRWCHGCSRDLGQGKDIFMYRGEMAFCSHECRYREMLLFDEE